MAHDEDVETKVKLRVVFVGIGGATCSGKTTLAKHLRSILPGSVILHQDDFAPPQELIPIHPEYNVQDWDSPEGAIDWPRMTKALNEMKATGIVPPEHYSHDHLNEQKEIPVEQERLDRWREHFAREQHQHELAGEKLVWVIVDGFLLYWNKEVVDFLDVRVFLRVPHDILKQRRHERHGYHTADPDMLPPSLTPISSVGLPCADPRHSTSTRCFTYGVQSDPEGTLWRDPPNYWEQIVWPAYVHAHQDMFKDGDIEKGAPNGKVPGLILFQSTRENVGHMIDETCTSLLEAVALKT